MNASRHPTAWLALALLAAAPVRAQEEACRRQSLMASVIDAQGTPVPGLSRANFSARFRGKPVNITFAELDTHTRRIIILLDASGSMLTERWKPALDAADDLLMKVPARIPVALSVFSDRVESKVSFSQGRAAIGAELTALRRGRKALPKGERETALWDSVLDALEMFGTPHLGDVIYAITDGDDNKSKHDYRKVEQALASSGVRLFAFMEDEVEVRPDLAGAMVLVGDNHFREAVKGTNGFLVSTGRGEFPINLKAEPDGLFAQQAAVMEAARSRLPREALDALYRQMEVFYRLDVELPEAVDKPRDWDLKLEGSGESKKVWNLVYPRKLMPCAAADR
jgi:hypothetical protein